MNNLADALQRQGKPTESVALLTEVIEVRKRVLSHEHPHTLENMHNLAIAYRDLKRL